MDLAKQLVRTIVRAFYTTEHVLVVEALAIHSTLVDADLAHILGMQTKALRRLCGRLREDGLISVHARPERREGAPPAYWQQHNNHGAQQAKERIFNRDWYYINFHRAIDSIKYRLYKLNKQIENLGAPTREKKDLICSRCKSEYTELEVMDSVDFDGNFRCHRCSGVLDSQEETSDAPAENESMKRMNVQFEKILSLMRQIDNTNVPENDFDTALQYYLPIDRPDSHPGTRGTPLEDGNKPLIASSKGLAMAPEQISVNLTDQTVDDAPSEQALAAQRAKQASQNALPDWISRSTLSGELTTVGAKEAAERQRREVDGLDLNSTHLTDTGKVDGDMEEDKKRAKEIIENTAMDEVWAELKAAQALEARRIAAQEHDDDVDEDDDDDDDDADDDVQFEDVEGVASKKMKMEDGSEKQATQASQQNDSAKVSDADDDDDDGLEFEDV